MKETRLTLGTPIPTRKQQTTPDTSQRDVHSTGAGNRGRWSTKRIAIYALFVALTMIASFFAVPFFPGANYLKYDPSGIVVLVAGFAFGPSAAAVVSVLGFMPHIFTDPFGAVIAILVALSLSIPASLVYRKLHTRTGAFLGIIAGSFLALITAIVCNIAIAPLYAHMSVQAVLSMIIPILIPFNLIKFTIHGVVTFLIYKPISKLVNR